MIDGLERRAPLHISPLRGSLAAAEPKRTHESEEALDFAHPTVGGEKAGYSPHKSQLKNPAEDAAALLLRLGFGIFALVIPSAALMSRWVIVVLVPIGAMLIVLAGLIRSDDQTSEHRVQINVEASVGLWLMFFSLWATASLLWTPVLAEASEKLFKTLGVIVLGYFAAAFLPLRMRAPNLHLISIGVICGAALLIWGAIAAFYGINFLRFPAATPARVAVMLSILVWAALAWMLIIHRRVLAVTIGSLVVVAILLNETARDALLPLGIGLVVFILSRYALEKVSFALALLSGIIVIFAPLIAGFSKFLAVTLSLSPSHTFTKLGKWWDFVLASPLHLITGRGFDAAQAARAAGLTPPDAPIGLLSDIWLELGLLGALSVAAILIIFFRHVGKMGEAVSPAGLAGLAAAFTYCICEQGATQTWWLNSIVVFALVLIGVQRGRHRSKHPLATLPRDQRIV